MEYNDHLRTTGTALKNWFIAQSQDALAVGVLWLVGLLIIRVPFAPLWAFLAFLLQFIPHFGPVLTLIGPALTALFILGWEHMIYVLILYAVVVVVDGFLFQPYLMKRTAKVPIWASILVPLVMAFFFPFWGLLLAPPLLAVFYAFKNKRKESPTAQVARRDLDVRSDNR
ncbi:MAG TPA: AI-2E family transporter [Terriglobales bacterium]|nr:AI-2E family transporter [Terriglobales bacterium]